MQEAAGQVAVRPLWGRWQDRELASCKTFDEVLEAAGLDWEVETVPLYTGDGVKVPNRGVRKRGSEGVMSVVGPKFVPIQNRDGFKLYQPLLDSGKVAIETAGMTNGGGRVWVLGRYAEDSEVAPGDRLGQYLLFTNSHQADASLRVMLINFRLACLNAMARAKAQAMADLTFRHLKGASGKLSGIGDHLARIEAEFQGMTHNLRKMALTKAPPLGLLVRRMLMPAHGTPRDPTAFEDEVDRTTERISEAVAQCPGNASSWGEGTLYQLWNGVTYWLTHLRQQDGAKRLASMFYGSGGGLMDKAMRQFLDVTEGSGAKLTDSLGQGESEQLADDVGRVVDHAGSALGN